jgi:SAM-dependent methyltransferase
VAAVDRRAAGDFARRMVGHLSSAMVVTMLELGRRTGLLDALATGPLSAEDLAERCGLVPRYVQEWLGVVVTGGVVVHDPDDDTFHLPPEHAAALTAASPYHLSGMVTIAAGTAASLEQLELAFREGGGIGYDEHTLDVDEVVDRLSRHRYDALLVDSYLAQVPGLLERLGDGARVLELGCGRGHAGRLVARAFPASEVVGLDLSSDAVARARHHAEAAALDNLGHVVGSATDPPAGPWDVVCAFDVVHDLAEPHAALAAARSVLAPDGMLLMIDSGAPPTLEEQAALPWAPMMYGVSLGHCLTVSLAQDGAGLGALWGREAATAALADAGFGHVDTFELKGDPMDLLYVARP